MTRKAAPKPDDAEQSKRFIDTAKEIEAGDDKALERAFKKIVTVSKPQSPKKGSL